VVRPEQLLYPQRKPATPRPAATILLLRDSTDGIEVLMTRRSMHASFAPGAFVFPGGAVDTSDEQWIGGVARRQTQSDAQTTHAITAIRETFEEVGVLLARRADGSMAKQADVEALDRSLPLFAQCKERGLTLAADCAFPFAHWITDRHLPRRFDVQFFVARMPQGQTPKSDCLEQFEAVWVHPANALAQHIAGAFEMIFPTVRTLERLLTFKSVDMLLAACGSEQPAWTSCPRGGLRGGAVVHQMEHDPAFDELALVCPDGQVLHSLDWQSPAPVPLLRNVQRLTASNGGIMTGPGTNSYIVGTVDTGFAVIDPGPNDGVHLRRLFDATGGDIRMIICTHSHEDHAPGARPLQAMCSSAPPVLGLPSGPDARHGTHFVPDRTLTDGEVLTVSGNGTTHRLSVVATPGHAANHVCLVLLEDGILFSGDHILSGSTTVIDPPDGNMTAYLESLDVLDTVCGRYDVEHILPAHGYARGNAREKIEGLKAHRLRREAKIAATVKAVPNGNVSDWVAQAYDDVPAALWPAATRSLLAHLERLKETGDES
jgi:recombination protein RecT